MASIKTCLHDEAERLALSGTRVRELLAKGESLPEEFTRPEVAEDLARRLPSELRRTHVDCHLVHGSERRGKDHHRWTRSSRRLREEHGRVEVLDGDVVRTHLSKGLGFSREDRDANIARIAFVAHLLARNGVWVVVAAISPYRAARDAARATIEKDARFVEVHVATPLETCIARDVKGLYKKAIAGEHRRRSHWRERSLRGSAVSGGPHRHHQPRRRPRRRPGPRGARRARSERGGVMLPRFSDPADIRDFVERLEAFESGTLSSEAFRAFRLTRGVYGQRQDGEQMLRVKIPMGLVGREQLDAIADVADRWSRGFGHVTTRQNVQLHFMKMEDVEAAMNRLDEAGLTTREACGNSVRTVTACELADVCESAPFDVTPYAEALTRMLLRHPLSASLPRKFKTAFSGCPHDCAKAAIHDLGFIAKVEEGVVGFRVLAAGGLSTSPQAAIELEPFVPAALIGRVGEAVVRLFHALGNRENRHRARLKYVLRKLGEDGLRAQYRAYRDEVDREAAGELTAALAPRRTPAPPAPTDQRAPGYLAWRASAVVNQKQSGYRAVHVRLRLGDVTSTQLRGIGEVIERFGDGSARLTIDQNVLLPWIDAKSLPAVHAALAALDLARLDVHTARDVTSCPGADTCNLAVTTSRRLANAIADRLATEDLSAISATSIKVSGCPNSCGQHHIADIGFHGGAKTFHLPGGDRTVPIYQLHLGGGVDERGARFGRQVVKAHRATRSRGRGPAPQALRGAPPRRSPPPPSSRASIRRESSRLSKTSSQDHPHLKTSSTWANRRAFPSRRHEGRGVRSVNLEAVAPIERLAWALDTYGDDLLFTSSFGAGSGVLLHMWSVLARALPVVFLDTGFLFPETLAYKDDLARRSSVCVSRSCGPSSRAPRPSSRVTARTSSGAIPTCAARRTRSTRSSPGSVKRGRGFRACDATRVPRAVIFPSSSNDLLARRKCIPSRR